MGYIEDLRKLVGSRPLILVGAVAIIIDEEGKILLEKRNYPKNYWGLPGGLMELGESTEETVKREVYEETGLKIDQLHFLNIYSGADYFVWAQNGDEFYTVTVAYYTQHFEGKIVVDLTESECVQFFHKNDLPKQIVKSHRIIIQEFVDRMDQH